MITVIHATRGRPKMYADARAAMLDNARHPDMIEYIASIDIDDKAMNEFAFAPTDVVIRGEPLGTVAACNRALYASHGEYLIHAVDDAKPPRHWDLFMTERIGDMTRPAVVKTSVVPDYNRKPYMLGPINGTRAWFKQCGYFLCPVYRHLFADDDMSKQAQAAGVILHAPEIVFHHNWGGPDFDDTMKTNYCSAQWRISRATFAAREAAGFPFMPEKWPE